MAARKPQPGKPQAKFIQITSSADGETGGVFLYALDADGNVWGYSSHSWYPMSSTRREHA